MPVLLFYGVFVSLSLFVSVLVNQLPLGGWVKVLLSLVGCVGGYMLILMLLGKALKWIALAVMAATVVLFYAIKVIF